MHSVIDSVLIKKGCPPVQKSANPGLIARVKGLFGAQDMTVGKPMTNILRFAIPLLIGNFAQQLYSTVDSIIVGNYVCTEALSAIGVSMPIINLLATGIFYLMSRKGTFFVRWNAIQALVSQVPLFIMNNILFWWTVRILFCFTDLSSAYIAYFITVNLYNVYDFIETVRSAVITRKGGVHRWYLYSTITDKMCKR